MSARWDQIQDLYHRALARNEEGRLPFLIEACSGDESLRQEVESLPKHRSEAQEVLEAPAVGTASEHLADAARRIGIGRQVGSYTVISMLGVGGMGEVYRALDLKLGRDVVIGKVTHAGNDFPS